MCIICTYAGACAGPEGTLIYSHFPNDEVNAALGIEDLSKQIWWYPEKYFAPFKWEKISFTFGKGQINFLVTSLIVQ